MGSGWFWVDSFRISAWYEGKPTHLVLIVLWLEKQFSFFNCFLILFYFLLNYSDSPSSKPYLNFKSLFLLLTSCSFQCKVISKPASHHVVNLHMIQAKLGHVLPQSLPKFPVLLCLPKSSLLSKTWTFNYTWGRVKDRGRLTLGHREQVSLMVIKTNNIRFY